MDRGNRLHLSRIGLGGSISGVFEESGALFGREAFEDLRDRSVKVGDGACLCLSKPLFKFCEGLLDGIEIGTVGRQEEGSTLHADRGSMFNAD